MKSRTGLQHFLRRDDVIVTNYFVTFRKNTLAPTGVFLFVRLIPSHRLVRIALGGYNIGSGAITTTNNFMKYREARIEAVPQVIQQKLKELHVEKTDYDPMTRMQRVVRSGLSKGLFLHGTTGSGKTYTLHAIRNQIQGGGMHVENFVELLEELKDRMAENKPIKSVLDSLLEKDYVFIDDIGAEKDSEWVQDRLYVIINRIYVGERTPFLATNLSLEEFTSRYSERITSRIMEMCEVIEMPNVDRRLS